jgi:hypothetical protein
MKGIWARLIPSISTNFILILSFYVNTRMSIHSALLSSGFTASTLYVHFSLPSILLALYFSPSLTLWWWWWLLLLYLPKNTRCEAPRYAVFSSLLLAYTAWVKIFSSALYSKTRRVLSLNNRDQVSHLQNTTSRIIVYVYFIIFILFSILNWMVASITRNNLLFIYSWMKFWNVTVVP